MAGLIGIGFSVFGSEAISTEAAADPQLAVILIGTDVPGVPTDLDNDANTGPGGLEAVYFTVDMFNLHTNQQIGTATDCLYNIDPATNAPGITLTANTTFNFPQGELVATGLTTVQPVLQPTAPFTHMTGAFSTSNSIVSGTKAFKNTSGNVRLSGLVDLTDFPADAGFSCIFIIDLD